MSTALGKQVSAFGDAVADARDDRWEIEELAQLGPKLAAVIVQSARKRMIAGVLTDPQVEEFKKVCAAMVSSMSRARPEIAAMSGLVGEFDDAILQLRELWAQLLDHRKPDVQTTMAPTLEQFRQAAKDSPPKQSWFEEDFTGLRGPGR